MTGIGGDGSCDEGCRKHRKEKGVELLPIVLTRIDDRLVHGQVTVGWTRAYNINIIVVVDDEIATDPIQRSILQMTAPPGIKVTALTVDEFIDRYKKAHYDKARTMLIFTNPSGIVKVVESGVTISSVNAGGMRFSPGKNRISKAISVDEENIQNFRKLLEMNIEVECRMMPSEPKVKIESLLSKGVK
jgi:PTS system mannose-specific IIB component